MIDLLYKNREFKYMVSMLSAKKQQCAPDRVSPSHRSTRSDSGSSLRRQCDGAVPAGADIQIIL